MQIAQVVPKTRTQKEAIFDYAIPPELLPIVRPGILVEIPFHGRKLEGIIVGLKRSSPISKLLSLVSIIDPVPVVDDNHIKLAQWMSDYYLASLGKTLFENIVPPAKKTIKKITEKNHTTFHASAYKVIRSKRYLIKKYLIIADFSNRLKVYLKAIKNTLLQNKSVIILVPDLTLIPYFTKYLKAPMAILHAGLTKTQRWLEWNKIREGRSKIIIGSNSALFAPVKNLGLIIIDQEENETYKNDRTPRFHAVKVAEELSNLTATNLVLGSITPRIETYYGAVNNKYRILTHKRSSIYGAKNITIVDMNSEKYVISNTLEKEIENSLAKKQKVLLVLNRKGEGTKFSCPDCGWIAFCEKCGLPLIPQKTENVCYRCKKNFLPVTICPKCQGVHLKPMGLGTTRLKKFLTDLFPESKIIQIEKELDGSAIRNNWDIAITTSYGLKSNWPRIALVGIVDTDQGLNFPDFHSPEKTFQVFYKFLKIGEQGIIQTHLPENPLIRSLASLNYERFFLEEIAQRRKYSWPPFTYLLRLLYKDIDKEKAKKEINRVFKLLLSISDKPYAISPPHPCFIEKERGKFRWQIVLKNSNVKVQMSNELKDILRTLPKGWIVDRDPVNLL